MARIRTWLAAVAAPGFERQFLTTLNAALHALAELRIK
jgi:hypothetical protein